MRDRTAVTPLTPSTEQGFWTAYAHVYEAVLTRFVPHVSLMGELAREVQPAHSVLDVGCGPGILAGHLAGNRVVVGVDYNHQMLAYARQKARSGLFFCRMDACELAIGDASFGSVASSNLLYFVSDPRRALTEMVRVLEPGGTLVVATPRIGCQISVLDRALTEEVEQHGDAELSALLEQFFAFNKAISTDGLRNLYNPRDLRDLVMGLEGIAEVTALRTTYLGQNCLVAARKEAR